MVGHAPVCNRPGEGGERGPLPPVPCYRNSRPQRNTLRAFSWLSTCSQRALVPTLRMGLNPAMNSPHLYAVGGLRIVWRKLLHPDSLSSLSFCLSLSSVLRLLKEGADPHSLTCSGGSLLHLVRTPDRGGCWAEWGERGFMRNPQFSSKRYIHLAYNEEESGVIGVVSGGHD